MVGGEACPGTDLNKILVQEQAAIERPYLYDVIVAVTRVGGKALADRNIETNVKPLSSRPGYAVGKGNGRAQEDIRIIDVAKLAPPIRYIQTQ